MQLYLLGLDRAVFLWYNGTGSTIRGEMVSTISDVAHRAGVGIGTVSRVLNNSTQVSEATRQKVLKAMEELDYVPNPFARRLSLGKTLTIPVQEVNHGFTPA